VLLTAAGVSLLGGGMMPGAPAQSSGRPPIDKGPAFAAVFSFLIAGSDGGGRRVVASAVSWIVWMPSGGGPPVVVCWTPVNPA